MSEEVIIVSGYGQPLSVLSLIRSGYTLFSVGYNSKGEPTTAIFKKDRNPYISTGPR